MNERDLVSHDAEHGVLGALMREPELCAEVGAFLGQEHFFEPDNGALYSLILALNSDAIRPDPLSLAEKMEWLPSGVATMSYANDLWSNVLSSANAVPYGKVVLERYTARRLHAVGEQIMQLACTKGDITAQVAKAQAEVMALAQQGSSPDVVQYRDVVASVIDEIDQRSRGKELEGIDTGLPDLDKIIRKMRPGNLFIVAGNPGTGKTVLATGIGDHNAIAEKKSIMGFSLEMPKEELVTRSISALGRIDKGVLDSGQLTPEDWEKVNAAKLGLDGADIRICDKPGLTMARICAIARYEFRVRPFHLMWVDYLTLIGSDPSVRFATRSAEVGSFSRGFKNLAKELGVPIILISQLNRVDGRPKASNLRDSGEIEQDADAIILGYRDAENPDGADGLTEWDVVKWRHGKPGRCLLQLQGQYQRFLSSAVSWDDYIGGSQPTGRQFKDFVK